MLLFSASYNKGFSFFQLAKVLRNSGVQPFPFAYPQMYFLFNSVPPKLLVHNLSYT
jgi:hypothetical protein